MVYASRRNMICIVIVGIGQVAELADAQDLGSCPERGGGSTPLLPIELNDGMLRRDGETRGGSSPLSTTPTIKKLRRTDKIFLIKFGQKRRMHVPAVASLGLQ